MVKSLESFNIIRVAEDYVLQIEDEDGTEQCRYAEDMREIQDGVGPDPTRTNELPECGPLEPNEHGLQALLDSISG